MGIILFNAAKPYLVRWHDPNLYNKRKDWTTANTAI